MLDKDYITKHFRELQTSICNALEELDGNSKFKTDQWERKEGGGGLTRVMENGDLIEKGGVNFSAVWGRTPDKVKANFAYNADEFYATGVSIVLHPQNPFIPIIHMNIRYFELNDETWWFGGGIDLTPHYLDREEAKLFHQKLKDICDGHDTRYYQIYKPWADEYFFIKHRNETRGVGGIFFDRLTGSGKKEQLFKFVADVGRNFIPIYQAIINKKRDVLFENNHREWQLIRRGRYVEFNLVLDRGTKFGLESNGRIESILMSLPPLASWQYDFQPTEESPEWETLKMLRKNIQWIDA
jgi:coproporphyrinogen III oxidase